MSKRTILKIGFSHILLPANANLGAVLKALTDAVEMDQRYDAKDGYVYFPELKPRGISMEMVDATKILKRNPDAPIEPEVIIEERYPRRRGLLLAEGGPK